MKRRKVFYLILFLLVLSVMPLSSATKKSSKGGSSSSQSQPEPVRVALNIVNRLLKYEPGFISSETQEWVYNNSKLTDAFKTEYSNYVQGLNSYVCWEDVDDPREECTPYEDLSEEEQEFYDKYGFPPFLDGQDRPDSVELLRYNEKDGYVVARGKGWKDYIMYLKVVNEDGQWKVDGAARINIPKHLQTGLGETYRR